MKTGKEGLGGTSMLSNNNNNKRKRKPARDPMSSTSTLDEESEDSESQSEDSESQSDSEAKQDQGIEQQQPNDPSSSQSTTKLPTLSKKSREAYRSQMNRKFDERRIFGEVIRARKTVQSLDETNGVERHEMWMPLPVVKKLEDDDGVAPSASHGGGGGGGGGGVTMSGVGLRGFEFEDDVEIQGGGMGMGGMSSFSNTVVGDEDDEEQGEGVTGKTQDGNEETTTPFEELEVLFSSTHAKTTYTIHYYFFTFSPNTFLILPCHA
jgi:hypothetical protein